MQNELLWFLLLGLNFLSILFVFKFFGRIGLYAWVPISSILANMQVILLVNLFGYETTLGNIMYAGGFLVTDILSERYGKRDAQRAVYIGFVSMVVTAVFMKIAVSFVPSEVAEGAANFASLKKIFDFMPRILFAGLLAYGVSQLHDVWAYDFWHRKFPALKYVWIRNNASTIVSQVIDTTVFTFVAFWRVYPFEVLLSIFFVTYFMKVLVALCDTPFVYWAARMKIKD